MKVRYHLDENVPHAIANGLKLRGVDVTTTTDAGLIEATDEAQLAFALEHSRVIFSFDDDLLAHASRGVEHSGIVYCHPRDRSIGQIVQALVALWRDNTAEEMHGKIFFV